MTISLVLRGPAERVVDESRFSKMNRDSGKDMLARLQGLGPRQIRRIDNAGVLYSRQWRRLQNGHHGGFYCARVAFAGRHLLCRRAHGFRQDNRLLALCLRQKSVS